jgi:hypothetical protein
MLPNNFVACGVTGLNDTAQDAAPEDNGTQLTTQAQLLAHEKTILSGKYYAGQAKNTLLEETDRHIKEQLFCAAKIEVLTIVLNELIEEEQIGKMDLHMLMAEKQAEIYLKEEQIWVNQLTGNNKWPLFYKFEE